MTDGFALFDTAIGSCGIAWGANGITGVQLPGRSEAATRARMRRRHPRAREGEPPAEVRAAIDAIVALLRGAPRTLDFVRLDMARVPAFNRRVYEIARGIGPGATLTYGDIATRLGLPDARDVGQAMGQNPFPIIVPCHRVLAAGGKLGGFSAPGGTATKRRMLIIEGAIAPTPTLFDHAGLGET